ncbi:MAG: type IV secretion system protein [Gammaproteobacteria bacterium]
MKYSEKVKKWIFLIGLIPLSCYAVMPVIDPNAIEQLIKEYRQLKNQYDLLKDTYNNQLAQLQQGKQMVQDAEGHYGYGGLINSDSNLKSREWSPDNWQDALKGLSGGNPERYQELALQYQKAHPTMALDEFKKGSSDENADLYQKKSQATQAATVNATYAFNDIKQHLENIHKISEKIDTAENTKAAVDLNTRMQTEMAYVQVQMLKQVAILNEQMAERSQEELSADKQAAEFNRLPDE